YPRLSLEAAVGRRPEGIVLARHGSRGGGPARGGGAKVRRKPPGQKRRAYKGHRGPVAPQRPAPVRGGGGPAPPPPSQGARAARLLHPEAFGQPDAATRGASR